MKRWKKLFANLFTELVLIGGAAAVAIGVGLYSFPAGLIAGGVLAIAGAVLSAIGGGDAK